MSVVTSVRFWGGISVLVGLVSQALPWWGITTAPNTAYWGVSFGPQTQQSQVVFLQDRLNTLLSANYAFITAVVLLTALSTLLGAILRRWSILTISLVLSLITILAFLQDVGNAVSHECDGYGPPGAATCISGLVGQGTYFYGTGSSMLTWGFQAGFYTFIASAIILLGALALQRHKSRIE